MGKYNSFVFDGHGLSEVNGSFDPGAVAQGVTEHDLVTIINNHTKSFLNKTSLAIHYDEQNYVDKDFMNNEYAAKAGITVHINAGGGTGVELFTPLNERDLKLDVELVESISKTMGVPNRGVKSKEYYSEKVFNRVNNGTAIGGVDYYKEIREAWSNGISLAILEVGFIDTSDLGKMQTNARKIGYHIADYICKLCGVATPALDVVVTTTPATKPATVITTGEYKVKIINDAIYVLNGPGSAYDIVQTIKKNEVYTITEVRNGYGKLKSGAGWINMKYTSVVSGTAPVKISEYKVKIVNAAIYVLNGPASSYDIVQTIKKNEVYTIVETKNGYGKLKSGAGWINLAYTTKL